MKTTIVGIAVLALSASGVALAGGMQSSKGEQPSAMFKKLDKNGDGTISQSEAQANPTLEKNWSEADANQNGEVSESEFSAFEATQQGGGREVESE